MPKSEAIGCKSQSAKASAEEEVFPYRQGTKNPVSNRQRICGGGKDASRTINHQLSIFNCLSILVLDNTIEEKLERESSVSKARRPPCVVSLALQKSVMSIQRTRDWSRWWNSHQEQLALLVLAIHWLGASRTPTRLEIGADGENCTPDLHITNMLLSLLSYARPNFLNPFHPVADFWLVTTVALRQAENALRDSRIIPYSAFSGLVRQVISMSTWRRAERANH